MLCRAVVPSQGELAVLGSDDCEEVADRHLILVSASRAEPEIEHGTLCSITDAAHNVSVVQIVSWS